MKALSCREMGVNCDFAAKGATTDEVKKILFAHAQKDHKDMLSKMSPQDMGVMAKKMEGLLNAQK